MSLSLKQVIGKFSRVAGPKISIHRTILLSSTLSIIPPVAVPSLSDVYMIEPAVRFDISG